MNIGSGRQSATDLVCDRFKLNSVKITFFVFSAVYLDGKGAL